MSALELKVYEIFKNKLGEKEAETVIEYFEEKAEHKYQDKKDILATKEDIPSVKAEVSRLEIAMEKGFRQNLQWTVATIIGCVGVIIAAIKLLH